MIIKKLKRYEYSRTRLEAEREKEAHLKEMELMSDNWKQKTINNYGNKKKSKQL